MRGRDSPGVEATAREVRNFMLETTIEEVHFRETGSHRGAGLPIPIELSGDIPQTATPDDS